MEDENFSSLPIETTHTGRNQLLISSHHCLRRCRGFYQYYQINGNGEDNETDESESGGEDELKSESFHSIFGFVMMVAEKTGWSRDEIYNNHSFAELNLYISDTPRLVRKKKKLTTGDELAAFFGTSIE